jgi:hypothetical protein
LPIILNLHITERKIMLKPVISLLATLFAASAFAGGVGLGGIGASPKMGSQPGSGVVSKISGCKWPDITDGQFSGDIKPISCPGNSESAKQAELNRFVVAASQCDSLPCLLAAIGY